MTGARALYTRGTMVEDRASEVTLPTTGRPRAIVVAFRRRRPDTRRTPSETAETAKKTVPCLIRSYEGPDGVLNGAWDRLITLVVEAWCWRDPDCLAAVEDCLAHLKRSVDQDWS
jgi:hypothetical protein